MKTTANERGYTMLETIIYIGLLIAVGGWLASMAHNAQYRYKIGRTAQQILDLKKAILQFTATNEDYSALTIQAMNEGSSLPTDMRTTNNTKARHALGGEIELGCVKNIPGIGSNNDYKYLFYITFKNLSKKACTELLTQGQFYGDGSDLDTLIINSSNAWRYEYSMYPKNNLNVTTFTIGENGFSSVENIHLTVSEALTACSRQNDNVITWIFS